MNRLITTTLSVLHNRQRLLLMLGFALILGMALFNGLTDFVEINGWSSGFIHPLHGGDHFLTMLAVGIWAAQLRGKAIWLLPVTFVSVMSLGGLAGAAGLFIPSAEPIILLSGLVFSVFIARRIRFSHQTSVIIVAFFAFFHGFAHGQEISTSASLISYTLGFMVATLLLHSAGILIVKLCVIVFALFISHLAYAQSSSNQLMSKTTAYYTLQTDSAHEFFIATYPEPPDNSSYYRQMLYSGEDGSSGDTAILQHHNIDFPPIVSGYDFVRVIYRASYQIAHEWLSADWLDKQQLGILFLTSGVGETSPPMAVVSDSSPRFCSAVFCHTANIPANNGFKISETILRFDLHNTFYTLATSFLTNGVGATSPPVWLAIFLVVFLSFRNIPPSFTGLFISRFLFSSNLRVIQTRLKSRSPPFAFSSTNPFGQPVLLIKTIKIISREEDAHTTDRSI
jgi:hydrogenase/urease accessory protein HupE